MKTMRSIVIMGVAGCGKSSLGAVVAQSIGWPLVEGDDHHSDSNRRKMQSGVPLTDADREGWLTTLCEQLRAHPNGVVLTCSALKKAYRDRLRKADSSVLFVFMDIQREQALIRVAARAHAHIFPTTLVDSQFATLESPTGEPGVLRVDAIAAMTRLQAEVTAWLAHKEPA